MQAWKTIPELSCFACQLYMGFTKKHPLVNPGGKLKMGTMSIWTTLRCVPLMYKNLRKPTGQEANWPASWLARQSASQAAVQMARHQLAYWAHTWPNTDQTDVQNMICCYRSVYRANLCRWLWPSSWIAARGFLHRFLMQAWKIIPEPFCFPCRPYMD